VRLTYTVCAFALDARVAHSPQARNSKNVAFTRT
jgi:hypothetical protein